MFYTHIQLQENPLTRSDYVSEATEGKERQETAPSWATYYVLYYWLCNERMWYHSVSTGTVLT